MAGDLASTIAILREIIADMRTNRLSGRQRAALRDAADALEAAKALRADRDLAHVLAVEAGTLTLAAEHRAAEAEAKLAALTDALEAAEKVIMELVDDSEPHWLCPLGPARAWRDKYGRST